jgi:uncharacterized protein YbjT (DUF2867 family)
MNWTASRDPSGASDVLPQLSGHDSRILIEEVACAIAEAQGALFAGRIQDLETSIIHQGELCAALKALQDKPFFNSSAPHDLVTAASRVRQQNLLFGAVVRRMRRHLETLRQLLNGLSLTYEPKPIKVPDRES